MQIVGHIERDGVRLEKPTISGRWDRALVADLEDGSQLVIFKINDPPRKPNRLALRAVHLTRPLGQVCRA
jgi:hypothetical protein